MLIIVCSLEELTGKKRVTEGEERETERQRETETERQRQTDKQTQTEIETYRQTSRQRDRQRCGEVMRRTRAWGDPDNS